MSSSGWGSCDDDLAERARRAGFELAVAHDLFVHHYGSRTFQGNGIDTERLLQENGDKFAHKWGLPVVGQRVMLRPWAEGGNGPQMTQMNADEKEQRTNFKENGRRNEPTGRPGPFHLRSSASSADKNSEVSVSLTMIVRDEESNLPHCLSSVAGLFDEIVVVDTGSTDRTRRSPASSVPGCSISCGSMTSPRPATRRSRGQRAIMLSGSTPMT